MKMKTMSVMTVIMLLTGILVTGCVSNKNETIPLPAPNGKFDGEFRVLKKKASGTGYDVIVKDTIRLTISPDSGYRVTGDTTKHAGSKGSYVYDYYYIKFNDKTYTDTASKRHLNGVYAYFYDGTRFEIARNYGTNVLGDTLKLQYELKRATN
ncbi:MAG: hypothetical protein EOP47_15325 [Sphingobacteriaceae bacterium]|nr:MAG: hypothetical protein EOP47_15325 [Sphingobacteriaceae bacterium]